MAKVEFVEGIQCKQCGNMVAEINIFTNQLCQKCGAHIMDIDLAYRSVSKGPDGKWVVIKVTHKLFHDTLEFVKEI